MGKLCDELQIIIEKIFQIRFKRVFIASYHFNHFRNQRLKIADQELRQEKVFFFVRICLNGRFHKRRNAYNGLRIYLLDSFHC